MLVLTKIRWEKEENAPQIIHCRYSDLKKDPEGYIKKIYLQLGRPFTPQFESNLKERIRKMEEQHRAVPYSHSLADAGLKEEQVMRSYSHYLESCKGFNYLN